MDRLSHMHYTTPLPNKNTQHIAYMHSYIHIYNRRREEPSSSRLYRSFYTLAG